MTEKKTAINDSLDQYINNEDNNEKKEYLNAKAKVKEIELKKKSKSIKGLIIIIGIITGFSTYIILLNRVHWSEVFLILLSVFISMLLIMFCFFYLTYLLELSSNKYQRIILRYETNHLKENIKKDIFENSINMSYKYLDQYYLQIREHAQNGFIVTVFVSIIGVLLITVGIILMFIDKTNPSYVTAGAGILIEFISAIFFYLYNKTVRSMSNYHNKLILSQNISIVLKITDTLPENEQIIVKKDIINELLKNINYYLINQDKYLNTNQEELNI